MQTIEELSASLKQKISDQPIEKIKVRRNSIVFQAPFPRSGERCVKSVSEGYKRARTFGTDYCSGAWFWRQV